MFVRNNDCCHFQAVQFFLVRRRNVPVCEEYQPCFLILLSYGSEHYHHALVIVFELVNIPQSAEIRRIAVGVIKRGGKTCAGRHIGAFTNEVKIRKCS
jgi:hypothetical protein